MVFENHLTSNPFSPEMFIRFINNISRVITNQEVVEEDALAKGYF